MVRRLQFLTNQVGGKYKPKTVNKDVPELVPLNDVKTKALLRSPYALDIRKKLAELYMDDQMNLEKASAIIKDLNAFFLDKNNGVFSNLKEKPLITNTLQRVKHNVKSMHRMLNQSTPRPAYEQGEIILKEDNGAYQHIVNSQNGNNLHYFRKVNSKVRQRFDAIVRQEGLAREGNGKPEEEFPEIDEQKPNQGDHQNDPDYDQEDIPEFCVSDSDGEMEDIP